MRANFCLFLFFAAASGCGSETLFKANFESDTPGELPMSSPPGDPVGDFIWLPEATVEGYEDMALVTDGGIAGKSLRLAGPQTPYGFKQTSFRTVESDILGDYYWAVWNGRLESFAQSADALRFTFGNVEVGFAQFRILDGQFWTRESGGDWESIGPIGEKEDHTIILQLDINDKTFQATVLQSAENLIVEPRPLRSLVAVRQKHLSLSAFFEGEGQGEISYLMDNVLITVRKPEQGGPESNG